MFVMEGYKVTQHILFGKPFGKFRDTQFELFLFSVSMVKFAQSQNLTFLSMLDVTGRS